MTVTYFSGPTLEVSWARFLGAGDVPVDGDYTDITADVRDVIRIDRGRGSETDSFSTGSLQITLDNRERQYDPEYGLGPYFGDLIPLKHIRVRMTYSATTTYLFHGLIRSWNQSWEPSNHDSVCIVTADDAMKVLALANLPTSSYAAEVMADTPLVWWRMGEQDGTTMMDSAGLNENGQYANGATFNTRTGLIAFDSDNSIEFDAATKQYADTKYALPGEVSIEFWLNTSATTEATRTIFGATSAPGLGPGIGGAYLWITIPDTGAATGKLFVQMGSSSTGATRSAYSSVDMATGETKHVVVCTRNGAPIKIYVNGADVTTGASGAGGVVFTALPTMFLGAIQHRAGFHFDGTLDELALYTGELSSARVLEHYTAGSTAFAGETVDERITRVLGYSGQLLFFPTDLDASDQTVQACDFGNGSTSVLAYLQTLEATENGRLFISADGTLTFHSRYHDAAGTVATAFSDATSSTLPYTALAPRYDDSQIINDAIVTRENGQQQRAQNSTSYNNYFPRTAQVTGLLMEADVEALDRANYTVYRYSDPTSRYDSIEVKPRSAPTTLYPVVRDREIGDRISVRRHPMNLSMAYTDELTVEGISHSIDVGGEWRTSYLTAPGDFSSVWLILDDATYGLLDTGRLGY